LNVNELIAKLEGMKKRGIIKGKEKIRYDEDGSHIDPTSISITSAYGEQDYVVIE